jgi:peptidoglycan/LPS O-acetylase OafA/YrhL
VTTDDHRNAAGELRGLTGLRIVAAVWVVAFHFHFTSLPGVADAVSVLGPLVTQGALGVDLFFVLSGFVIAHTYLERLGPAFRALPTLRFVWARACRIWPAYVLVFNLFGMWLVAKLLLGHDDNVAFQAVQPSMGLGAWARQMVMVQLWDQPYFDGASWVGSTWSISAEWLAYLLFPVAALVFFRLRRLPAAVLMGGALLLMVPMTWAYVATGSPYFPFSWLIRILCGFSAGVLTYLAVRRLRGGAQVNRRASVVAAVLMVVVPVGLVVGELAGPGRGGAVIAVFPLLVGALARADRGPAVFLARPAMVHGGHLSYALYLVHIPIFEVYWTAQQHIGWLTEGSVAAHSVGLAVLASTFLVAAALHGVIEEPARRLLRRLALPRARRGEPRVTVPEPTDPAHAETVAAFAAARRRADRDAHSTTHGNARHAATPHRRSTLAAALVNAEQRRPAHRAELADDLERATFIRAQYLHAGG